MNRNFIFAFILLVTLSIVNAETKFGKCEGRDPVPELLTVKITPDPIKPGQQTFEVSITPNYNITSGTELDIDVIDEVNPKILVTYSQQICSQTDCPVKAGSPFSSTQKFTVPEKLSSKYFIRVQHFSSDPDVTDSIACTIAFIG